MLNYKKRAFTITELVIVIAVVAILAAVLIPTFSNVVKKANQTADIQAVRNANTALANAEVLDGKPASTISDALAVVAQAGYNVESFTPSSNGDILWDQANNRFALVDNEGKVVLQDEGKPIDTSKIVKIGENRTSVDIWMITESVAELESGRYSYYLKNGVATDLTVKAGVDVGANEGISITYATNATQSVDIRTNGGTLTVNASNSDVHHYGTATSITLKSGHVVLESTAEVSKIKVSGGVITNAHNKKFELVADGENVEGVTVDGKKVYKVQFFSEENVKLAEQLVVEGDKARDPELKNFGKAGHTFAGWMNGQDKYDLETTVVTSDLTLKASWTANSYTITFENSELEEQTMSVTYGESYTLPTPTRTGYTFAGWYSGEYKYDDGIWASEENLTLTAKWNVIEYTITYNLADGTNHQDNPATYTIEDAVTLQDPTKDGCVFVGWVEGNTIEAGSTGNKTFTAKWAKVITIAEVDAIMNRSTAEAGYQRVLDLSSADYNGYDVFYFEKGTYNFGRAQTQEIDGHTGNKISLTIVVNRSVELIGDSTVFYSTGNNVFSGGFIQVNNNAAGDRISFSMSGITIENGIRENGEYNPNSAITFGTKDCIIVEGNGIVEEGVAFIGDVKIDKCTFIGFPVNTIVIGGGSETTAEITNNVIIGSTFVNDDAVVGSVQTAVGIVSIECKSTIITGNTIVGAAVGLDGTSNVIGGVGIAIVGLDSKTLISENTITTTLQSVLLSYCKIENIEIVGNTYLQTTPIPKLSIDLAENEAVVQQSNNIFFEKQVGEVLVSYFDPSWGDGGYSFATMEEAKAKEGVTTIYVADDNGTITETWNLVDGEWVQE